MEPKPKRRRRSRSRPITEYTDRTSDDWAWNSSLLLSKIQSNANSHCSTWQGARGPYGNLFGAYKLHDGQWRCQMTQANRLIYQTHYNQSVKGYIVRMSCQNRHCCNWQHMSLQEEYRGGHLNANRQR